MFDRQKYLSIALPLVFICFLIRLLILPKLISDQSVLSIVFFSGVIISVLGARLLSSRKR